MEAAHYTWRIPSEATAAFLEETVIELPGVVAVKADPSLGVATVLYDPRLTDSLDIGDEISRRGYRARLVARSEPVRH